MGPVGEASPKHQSQESDLHEMAFPLLTGLVHTVLWSGLVFLGSPGHVGDAWRLMY